MEVTVRQEGEVTVIRAAGRMTIGEPGANLLETVRNELEGGNRKLVLSLAQVNRIDSSGIGELVAAHASAGRNGGELKLAALSPKLATVLQITQLMGVLESFESETDAVMSFAGADEG
jgi:anti-sigma B factor antagonist